MLLNEQYKSTEEAVQKTTLKLKQVWNHFCEKKQQLSDIQVRLPWAAREHKTGS